MGIKVGWEVGSRKSERALVGVEIGTGQSVKLKKPKHQSQSVVALVIEGRNASRSGKEKMRRVRSRVVGWREGAKVQSGGGGRWYEAEVGTFLRLLFDGKLEMEAGLTSQHQHPWTADAQGFDGGHPRIPYNQPGRAMMPQSLLSTSCSLAPAHQCAGRPSSRSMALSKQFFVVKWPKRLMGAGDIDGAYKAIVQPLPWRTRASDAHIHAKQRLPRKRCHGGILIMACRKPIPGSGAS